MIELKDNQILLSTRFAEVDMMEVVHHSKYWIWFEEARFDFFKKVLKVSTEEIRSSEILMPVIDCECRYLTAIPWDKKVIIETNLEITKAPYFNFYYKVYFCTNKKMLSKAKTKQVFIDKSFKLKLKTPEFLSEAVKQAFVIKPYAFIVNE